jgi:hypothetical protein
MLKCFLKKGCSKSSRRPRIELIRDKSIADTSFAYAWRTNHYNFDWNGFIVFAWSFAAVHILLLFILKTFIKND